MRTIGSFFQLFMMFFIGIFLYETMYLCAVTLTLHFRSLEESWHAIIGDTAVARALLESVLGKSIVTGLFSFPTAAVALLLAILFLLISQIFLHFARRQRRIFERR